MKKALLVKNAFLNSKSFDKIAEDLQFYAAKHGFEFILKTNKDFLEDLDSLPSQGVFWDKDIPLALMLENLGVRLSNSAKSIALCDDKTLSHALIGKKLPCPRTFILPMSFPNIGYPDYSFFQSIEKQLRYPFVIKEGKGSYGWQVYLVKNREEALSCLKQIGTKPCLCQEFIEESFGRDIRVYVVNGKVISTMRRENTTGDFRANVEIGGQAFPHTLSAKEEALALAACRLMGLDFCGVDLLFSKSGPLLCEVNSNAHYAALEKLSGINPASEISRMIGERL